MSLFYTKVDATHLGISETENDPNPPIVTTRGELQGAIASLETSKAGHENEVVLATEAISQKQEWLDQCDILEIE